VFLQKWPGIASLPVATRCRRIEQLSAVGSLKADQVETQEHLLNHTLTLL
jgi:hypothetical protein